MRVSLLTLLIISGASMQISYAIENSEMIKGNEGFSSSTRHQQEKPQDFIEHTTILNEEKGRLDPPTDNDQFIPQSFTERVKQIRQYLWELWSDPIGFKGMFDNVNFF